MNTTIQKVLEIDLVKDTANIKSYDNLNQYVGGVGLGLKMMESYKSRKPIIFAIGPLNGFFPFASKTAVILNNNNAVEDLYMGGSLGQRIRFAGLNAIIIYGSSKTAKIINIFNDEATLEKSPTETRELGLPGKRSVIEFEGTKLKTDKFFETPDNLLEKAFVEKNLAGMVITGTKTFTPKKFDEYTNLYETILGKKDSVARVEGDNPSCSNCPLGCGVSQKGELGGNVLVHSLVACGSSEKIYSDIGLVFSCLNVLGYDYKHEDLENLPALVEETLRNLA